MTVMTTLNATAQVYLPKKFRARGMSAFVMFFSLGMGIGAFTWGWLAKASDVGLALSVAAIVMLAAAIFTHSKTLGPLNIENQTEEDRS